MDDLLMAITYSWEISRLDCYPTHEGKTNVVFAIHWKRQAVDGGYIAAIGGIEPIDFDSTAAFIPYENLTKSQVEKWLEKSFGEEKIAALADGLSVNISSQINSIPSLPW
jgi:hypothetical protein